MYHDPFLIFRILFFPNGATCKTQTLSHFLTFSLSHSLTLSLSHCLTLPGVLPPPRCLLALAADPPERGCQIKIPHSPGSGGMGLRRGYSTCR